VNRVLTPFAFNSMFLDYIWNPTSTRYLNNVCG